MSALIDDISRIVASPVSRRQAIRLVGGALGGAVLASLGLGTASRPLSAAQRCTHGQKSCGGKCYRSDYTCCAGTLGCPEGQKCCVSTCCAQNQTCCNGTCCAQNQPCCNGTCCTRGQTCCNGICCAAGQCAGMGSRAVCCPVGQEVCGTETIPTCCAPGYVCCGNHKCYKRSPSASNPCLG